MIDIHAIARHYGGEVSGGQALIPAIGHSDRDRGVAIRAADDAPDGCLVHCFNGGDPLAEKDRLRADSFLPPLQPLSDRIPWSPPRRNASPLHEHAVGLAPGQEIVATFDFLAANGGLIYRKHRIEPGSDGRAKSFQYDRPNGQGGWLRGAGEDRVPYRLPDLLTAPRDLPILMVEGEAKADRLAEWGFLATSHKDWKGFEFSGYVKRRTVFILPDNDEAGEKQAQTAVEGVETAEGSAFLIRLPGLPEGGDVLDWDGGPDDLRNLMAAAERTGAEPLATLDLVALSAKPAIAKRFAIPGLAPAAEVTLLTGAGSAGKSLLAQQLATAAAAGVPTLGFELEQMNALYLTCEDDDEQLHWRQHHLCKALGVGMADLAEHLHLASLRGALDSDIATFTPEGVLKPTAMFDRLCATIEASGARIAFLDNVAHLFNGNENDRGEVTRFVNLLNRLAGETGAAILLLGHPNKSGDTYSGSTAWLNAVRSQVLIEHDVDTDLRTLTIGKANYARKGDQVRFLWQDWAFVLEDELSPERASELREAQTAAADNDLFLACLRERTRQKRAVSEKASPTFAPKVFAAMLESKGIGQKRLNGAMDRLYRIGLIERGELPWRSDDRKAVFGLRETAGNCAGNTCGERG